MNSLVDLFHRLLSFSFFQVFAEGVLFRNAVSASKTIPYCDVLSVVVVEVKVVHRMTCCTVDDFRSRQILSIICSIKLDVSFMN